MEGSTARIRPEVVHTSCPRAICLVRSLNRGLAELWMDRELEARDPVEAHSLNDLMQGEAIAVSVRDVLGRVSHYLALHAFYDADMSSPVLERVAEGMEHDAFVAHAAFLPVPAEPLTPLARQPPVLVRPEI